MTADLVPHLRRARDHIDRHSAQPLDLDRLRHATLTVTEVCMIVGFASLGSFSSRFTPLTGETPTDYRAR